MDLDTFFLNSLLVWTTSKVNDKNKMEIKNTPCGYVVARTMALFTWRHESFFFMAEHCFLLEICDAACIVWTNDLGD